jgi:hypothetical protein
MADRNRTSANAWRNWSKGTCRNVKYNSVPTIGQMAASSGDAKSGSSNPNADPLSTAAK